MANIEKTLEDYLKFRPSGRPNINRRIYDALTDRNSPVRNLFVPLEFFRLMDNEIKFFYDNIENYLLIKKHYKEIRITGKRRQYFFWIFYSILLTRHQDNTNNANLLDAMRCIEDELQAVQNKIQSPIEDNFNFSKTQQDCESFPKITEKIKYLIEIQAACKHLEIFNPYYSEFILSCDIEIEKYKALLAADNTDKIDSDIGIGKIEVKEFAKIMSNWRAERFLEYEKTGKMRVYIRQWRKGEDPTVLCGLINQLYALSFLRNKDGGNTERAIKGAAKRFFEKRYGIDISEEYRKAGRKAENQQLFADLLDY